MIYLFLLMVSVICVYQLISRIDVFFQGVKIFFQVVSPFFYGFLIAYVLNIPCLRLQLLFRKSRVTFIVRKRKGLSVLITYLLLGVLIYFILMLIVPNVYASVSTFIKNFGTYYNQIDEAVEYINNLNIFGININMEKILADAQSFGLQNLSASISAAFEMSSAVFKGFLAIISSIYILIEKDKFASYMRRFLKAVAPETVVAFLLKYGHQLNHNCKQYIYTQTIDGCILGTIATIELTVLGSPYALTLGIMLGIVNYIPYFGSIIGSLGAVAVVGLTQGLPKAAITAVILLVTQQIDGNIIQPKLMGNSFSLSPLLVIISITIFGAFWGVIGMLAAIPVVVVLKDMLDDLIDYRERKSTENQILTEER